MAPRRFPLSEAAAAQQQKHVLQLPMKNDKILLVKPSHGKTFAKKN